MPEVGNIILALACYERRVVALEAQGELLRLECARISLGAVGGDEQLGLRGGVGPMAIGALSVCDG